MLDQLREAFLVDQLKAAGIMGTSKAGKPYSRLADRMLIPWHDPTGAVTFLQARALGDRGPKYLSCGPAPTGPYIPGGRFGPEGAERPLGLFEGAVDAAAAHTRRGIRAVAVYNAALCRPGTLGPADRGGIPDGKNSGCDRGGRRRHGGRESAAKVD